MNVWSGNCTLLLSKVTDGTDPLEIHVKLLLLINRYNLYKVLACSTTFFQLSLFCATFFQLRMFMLFISSKTSSSQRVLGLPIGVIDMGFHLLIFCTILSSAMRSTWPVVARGVRPLLLLEVAF